MYQLQHGAGTVVITVLAGDNGAVRLYALSKVMAALMIVDLEARCSTNRGVLQVHVPTDVQRQQVVAAVRMAATMVRH